MQPNLREPRSKRFVPYFAQKELLPFETIEKNGKKYIILENYVGYLTAKGVEIKDERSIQQLCEKGNFGIGYLSKDIPEFSDKRRSLSNFNEINDDGECQQHCQETSLSSKNQCEILYLMFEEAFFLSYGLGCLIVKESNKELSISEMWKKFCWLALDGRFPCKYVAYHYFRSKGWIVKSGLKYGTDFVLYKDGPAFYHSTYCVVVREVSSDFNEQSLTWLELLSLNRVNEHVAKDTLLCYVMKNKDTDLLDPSCIPTFNVQEVLLRRWIPSEEREDN
ncbi:tRNA-splicing endonuclease subunit Sen2 [Centruroides vittatus]|uniref:tRNA-splicing endonuclease subunit Sen2 n=1 Tax=Centruroides vittatus TaxID=120091 RepID=UPI00350EEA5B